MTNSGTWGGLENLPKSLDLGHQRLIFSCNPPPGYDFLPIFKEFPNTVSSANPRGMADLGRAAVDKQCLQNFIDFAKNVERAAENSQNAPQNHPKGQSWAVLGAFGRYWLGALGALLGATGP